MNCVQIVLPILDKSRSATVTGDRRVVTSGMWLSGPRLGLRERGDCSSETLATERGDNRDRVVTLAIRARLRLAGVRMAFTRTI